MENLDRKEWKNSARNGFKKWEPDGGMDKYVGQQYQQKHDYIIIILYIYIYI